MSIAPLLAINPFFAQGKPIENSVGWITGTLIGDLALPLCVLAVAMVGLMMLSGRMPVRRAMQVVLGCFILLGAPVIASAFLTPAQSGPVTIAVSEAPVERDPRSDLPQSTYDPYAGASLRSE